MTVNEVDLDELGHSPSDSEPEDYLWVARRAPCRKGREKSGDPLTLLPRAKSRTTLHGQTASRSRSAPPPSLSPNHRLHAAIVAKGGIPFLKAMLTTATTVDLTFDDDDWTPPPPSAKLYRAASVGNSWGVTSFGRGFNWKKNDDEKENDDWDDWDREAKQHSEAASSSSTGTSSSQLQKTRTSWVSAPIITKPVPSSSPPVITAISAPSPPFMSGSFISGPLAKSPVQSRCASPRPLSPASISSSLGSPRAPIPRSPSSPRIPGSPRPRRRSSQQRVSLIAGRVSIVPAEPPSPPPTGPQRLVRANSTASFLSAASSSGPPTPGVDKTPLVTERSISEFVIEKEIGRGAYGLVKRAREMRDDGSLGPPLVIKQIIKSRILADCWKRHPKYGTIPIEIYVMSAISSTSYVLPPRRPWDPSRFSPDADSFWVEGQVVNGHPNICPLLDFFEDNHYYYLVLPSTTPEPIPNEPPPPADLFDLVENYPHGLPPSLIRSYLGQIADALCFLHSKGIVHRDIKDENVVLGPAGKCVLIDFGSSGLVKKGGWDTFSGTLDYAGPEILRGERYQGKEQDVWAFGVVAYVMFVGECPFTTAAEAQEGLESPFSNAAIALDERCAEDKEKEGEESDGGGALGDGAALVRACLQLEVGARPTFEKILQCRFLSGNPGWGLA